jgi:hypothetical protein
VVNKYGIPDWIEERVRKRDKYCVYCHVKLMPYSLNGPRGKTATIEHIDNDGSLKDENNIAMCCFSCNSSKGVKKLLDWFEPPYCKKKKINKATVAPIIKKYLKNN